MRSFSQFLFLIIILNSISVLSAQSDTPPISRSNYSLLWEITGNNMEQPSYLFGSMHMRNKAVFEFPDSLLIALKNCEVFAGEVHMDSAMQRIFELYIGGDELNISLSDEVLFDTTPPPPARLEEVIDTGSRRRNQERLYTSREIEQQYERQLIYNQKGDMPTMLDAYLMNLARSYGLATTGLENIDEHIGDGDDTDAAVPGFLGGNSANLMDLYYRGDLVEIGKYVKANIPAFEIFDLTPRNHIMVRSMNHIMSDSPLFAVVGTAHLPGEEGVINLLRENGYHLRQVTAEFASDYEIPVPIKDERPWPQEYDQSKTISFSMPLGTLFRYFDEASVQHYSFDIGKGLSYLVMSKEMFPEDYEDFDEAFFEQDGYTVLSKSPIEDIQQKGFNYKLSKRGQDIENYLARVYFHNHRMYYLEVGAYESGTLSTEDPQLFFDAFQIIDKPSNKWTNLVDNPGGFSVRMPQHYTASSGTVKINDFFSPEISFYEQRYFAGSDQQTNWLLVKWLDADLRTSESDSAALVNAYETMKPLYSIRGSDYELDLEGASPTLLFTSDLAEGNLLATGKLILRGNRIYHVFSVDKINNGQGKKFLPSFKLRPNEINLCNQKVYTIDSAVVISVPSMPLDVDKKEKQKSADFYAYTMQDSLSGATYLIEIQKQHPLSSVRNIEHYFDVKSKQLEVDGFTIKSADSVENLGDYSGIDLYFTKSNSHLQQRTQLVRIGHYLIRQSVFGDEEYLQSPSVQNFFTGIQVIDSTHFMQVSDRAKAETVLMHFASGDLEKIKEAGTALEPQWAFDPSNLPALSTALLAEWPEKAEIPAIQEKLIKAMGYIDPHSSIPAMRDLYSGLAGKQLLQELILAELARIGSAESMAVFFDLYRQSANIQQNGSSKVFLPIEENLDLFTSNISQFVKLLEDKKDHIHLWKLADLAMQQNPQAARTTLSSYFPVFIEGAKTQLLKIYGNDVTGALKANRNSEYIFSFFKTAGIASADVISLAEDYFENKTAAAGSLWAADFLLAQDKKLHRQTLRSLLSNEESFYKTINVINKNKAYHLVRKQDYNQQLIAKGMVEDFLKESGHAVTTMELIERTEVSFKGEQKITFIYGFSTAEGENFVAVGGMFSANKKDMNFEPLVLTSEFPVSPLRRVLKAKEMISEITD